MLFETTFAGSLPKPAWLAEPETLWPSWQLAGDDLRTAQRDAARVAMFEQKRAGIDTVTDGEQFRRHFVHGFAGALDGVDTNKIARRGIRDDRYEADCPTITGPVRRRTSVHADEMRFARDATTGPPEGHAARTDDDRRHAQRTITTVAAKKRRSRSRTRYGTRSRSWSRSASTSSNSTSPRSTSTSTTWRRGVSRLWTRA